MSIATIRTGARTILAAVSGVQNVDEESPIALDAELADVMRRDTSGRPHFWLVSVASERPLHGVGLLERRRRVQIDGWLGVATDAPQDGTPSAETARTLLDAVVSAFAAASNRTLGGTAQDAWDYAPSPVVLADVTVGRTQERCHHMRLTFLASEDA